MKKITLPSFFLFDAMLMAGFGLITLRYAQLAQSLGKNILYLVGLTIVIINFAFAIFCLILFIAYSLPPPESNKED